MNKILIVCGQTATGKTNIALHLTKVLPAEIISADSRQVYKSMDIGTGKDKPKHIKIWGYDLVAPSENFSVAHFYQYAWKLIKKFWQQNKLPIIVGGTGQYLNCLINPPASIYIKPNYELRQKLNGLTIKELQEKLKKIDTHKWQRMNHSDQHNPRRLIRALEIASSQKGVSFPQERILLKGSSQVFLVGLTAPLPQLDQRINQRVLTRAKHDMTKEVETLIKKYLNWELPAFSATGYKQWRDYLEGKTTKAQAISLWQTSERQYARRQMTWFKKQPGINWFDITTSNWQTALVDIVKNWYASTQ